MTGHHMLNGNRLAIIIGINEYVDPKIPKLPGAEYDAKEIYERLSDPNRGNFIIQSYLVGEDAKCTEIRKAINDAFWKTDPHDLVLFYFSGHGFVDGYNDGYIAPYDMRLDEPFTFGINMRELRETISKSKNKKNVVVILDCCYSGIATKGDKSLSTINLTKEDFEKHLDFSGEGRIILASSQANQRSKEIEVPHRDNMKPHPHGNFTFHLIQGLDGEASDKNTGIITLGGLHEYVEDKMKNENQQQPKFSVTEGSQLKGIEITVVPDEWKKNRDTVIQEIEESCDKKDQIFTLFHGAKKVNELIELDPNNTQIAKFKVVIADALQTYTGMIVNWLAANAINVAPRIARISENLFTDLFNLESYLSFNKFVNMDPIQLNRLSALSDVINEKTSIDIFILRLTPPKSSLSSRMDGGRR
jgi:hypothetical protein